MDPADLAARAFSARKGGMADDAAPPVPDMADAEDPKVQVAQDVLDAFSGGDPAALASALAEFVSYCK